MLPGQFQRRGHVAGRLHGVTFLGQHPPQDIRGDAVVFDQQDAQTPVAARGGRRGRGLRPGRRAPNGSRTRNVAPLSRPSLRASMLPPCSSVMALLIARPNPSPPNCRPMDCSACVNALNSRGSAAASMPMPLSLTSVTTRRPRRGRNGCDPASLRRELDRVLQEVPEHLLQAGQIGFDPVGRIRPHVHVELQPARSMSGRQTSTA